MTKKQRNSKVFFIAAITVSVAAATLLSIESYLEPQGASLCMTAGCDIVANYIRVKEVLLVTGGAAFFWLLALSIYFSHRYAKLSPIFPLALLTPALSFDGSLLGYQVFTIGKYCLLCHLVAYTLLITSFLWSLSIKKIQIFVCLLFCWLGGFGSQGIIEAPLPADTGQKMILLETRSPADSTIAKKPTVTLFFSMHCPHCMELIASFESMNLAHINWKFANIDQDKESLQKIAEFMERAKKERDVFSLLLGIKKAQAKNGYGKQTLKLIREKNRHTLQFLTNLGVNSIPVVLIDKANKSKLILQGKNESLLHIKLFSQTDTNNT